jgi:hypothetical protein
VIPNPVAVAPSQRVRELLRAHLAVNPGVAIGPPETIPRSVGKAARLDERSRA